MKLEVINLQNEKTGDVELPSQFSEEVRPDLIKRAVLTIQNNRRQPYGADPEAGKKASAKLSRRRNKYRTAYGHGISRVPRKILSRRGTRMNWVGALAPGTVGGRRAHPPKASKSWELKINKKERRKAIRSAMSATMQKSIVKERGHIPPERYPFIIDDSIEQLATTKDVRSAFEKIGLKKELERTSERTIRAGKGKTRGRRYRTKKGPLIVVSSACKILKAGKNIPGIEIETVSRINAELLAPGTHAGRLTLFTRKSVDAIKSQGLFTDKEKVLEKTEKK